MRLIDADKIPYQEAEYRFSSDSDTDVDFITIKFAVDALPTVDAEPVIRCKDCGQREYGCSTFIDHNQIYGFCAWGWKAERNEE
jgi:hypothetical protein